MALSFAESLSSTAGAHGSPPGARSRVVVGGSAAPGALIFFKETSSVFTVHPAPQASQERSDTVKRGMTQHLPGHRSMTLPAVSRTFSGGWGRPGDRLASAPTMSAEHACVREPRVDRPGLFRAEERVRGRGAEARVA